MLNPRKTNDLEHPETLDNVAETHKTGKVTKLFSTGRWKDESENGRANSRSHSAFGGNDGETPFSVYGINIVKSVATWSKVNILAVSKDMDTKTWKWQGELMSIEVQSISKPDFAVFEVLSGEGEGKLMKNIIALPDFRKL